MLSSFCFKLRKTIRGIQLLKFTLTLRIAENTVIYCHLSNKKQMRQDSVHIRLSTLDPAVGGRGLKWAGGRLESATSFNEGVPGSSAVLLPLLLPALMILSQNSFLDNLGKKKGNRDCLWSLQQSLWYSLNRGYRILRPNLLNNYIDCFFLRLEWTWTVMRCKDL